MPPFQWYPNDENYPVQSFDYPVPPPLIDPDEGTTMAVAFNVEWLPYILGALDQLMLFSTWEGTADEIKLAVDRAANLKSLFGTDQTLIPAPYWDDASDNEIEMPSDDQIWYGEVTDWLAPVDSLNFEQNIALWALTGFVAYAAGVGSAIFFRTTAKRFIIAIESADVEQIIRIVIDSASFNAPVPADSGIVEIEVLGDEAITEHDIYIIQGEA